jgi:integrase/recombinase XerD
LLCIVKYEPKARNKAALTLFWDLDARNHEVTMLQIKNVRLRDRWAEGEIPYNTKTSGGPILLTCSFPFVRNWINLHPVKDDPEARLICNLYDGTAVGPEAMWGMMKRLKERIERMLKQGSVTDPQEREKLQQLLERGYQLVESHEHVYDDAGSYNRDDDVVKPERSSSHYNRRSGTNWNYF